MNQRTGEFVLEEATIASIHAAMQQGSLSCRQLIQMYLDIIEKYDKAGPGINSVISINPRALQ